MPPLPFVDTHVHFWDLKDPELEYNWLTWDATNEVFPNVDALKAPLYGAAEYMAETRFHNVTKCVHVQAAVGIQDPIAETRSLEEQADRLGFPHGIVAHCDLASPQAAATLDGHASFRNLRGIRDFGHGDYLTDASWRRGYALLGARNLVCCLDPVPENLGKARALAELFPDVVLCIDHAAFPRSRDQDYFAFWKRQMSDVAEAPNVVCKISGLGMGDNSWTVESIRPWVLTCIEMFGTDRSFFGTNWPVDRLYSSYGDVVTAYAQIIAEFTLDEQTALFSTNAERIFRL